jgi:signal transduction histidine kinase
VEPATLAPTAELAAFRVVQEALANSVKHAPGASVEVELRHDGPAVAIVVRDRGGRRPAPDGARTDGGGMGLVGMRERVAQASGTLEAGPADDGWEVVARFTATSDAPANRSVVHPAT